MVSGLFGTVVGLFIVRSAIYFGQICNDLSARKTEKEKLKNKQPQWLNTLQHVLITSSARVGSGQTNGSALL